MRRMIFNLVGLACVLALSMAQAPALPEMAASRPADTGAEDLVPLPIELPSPLFTGTPKNISTPNLEPPSGQARPAFLAPKGIRNVAVETEVTASVFSPKLGELEQIVDGDKEGTDGSCVELEPGIQYVQIDLGAEYELFAVLFWHYHQEARVYFDVIVRASTDPDFISGVQTLYNNDHDNSAGLGVGADKEYIETYEGRLVDGKKTRARYLRFYSHGNTSNDLNHCIEIEAYGRKIE